MFVGLDLHKLYTQYAIMDNDGILLEEGRLQNDPDKIKAFSDSLINACAVIESSSTWYWLYKIFSERHKVILSNPVKTKAIAWAKVKTDKIDSIMLADLLRGGYIAESYILETTLKHCVRPPSAHIS